MTSSDHGITDEQAQTALRLALGRSIAQREVPDELIASVSKQLAGFRRPVPIRRLGICAYGVCLDYFVEPGEWRELLFELLDGPRVRSIRYFPWGIIDDDLIQIRVEHEMPELASFVRPLEAVPHH